MYSRSLGGVLRRCVSRIAAAPSSQLFFRRLHTQPIPAELYAQPETFVTTLPSGLRVASQKTDDETVTVGVFIDSGSRYETKENNGVAHFLEHMVFKGTNKRTRIQLEKEVEDMGGHLNAYTAREQTVYYAKAFKKDLPQAVDILSDILTNSRFDINAIEEERHVILREMEEVEKNFEEVIFDRLHMCVFRDSPLGYTILGPPENIKSIQRQWIVDYIEQNYTADRIVVAAAGDVDHKTLVQLAESQFAKFKSSKRPEIVVRTEKPYFCGSQILQQDLDVPVLHMAIGYEGVSWTDPVQPAFMLMQAILGSYDFQNEGLVPGRLSGNRTINNVANEREMSCVNTYTGFNTCYKDTGLFGFYFVTPLYATLEAMQQLQFSVANFAYSITEEEVQMAKKILKANLFGSLDTTTAICEDIGRQILVYGRRIPLPEIYKRIDAIDAAEIRRVAWDKLYDAEIGVVGIGQTQAVFRYNMNRRRTALKRW